MKNTMLHIFKSLKILISYVVCLIISIFYMLYLDGSSGVLLLSFMILVPIMSMVLMLISAKNVNIDLKVSNSTIKKNAPLDVTIKLSKKNVIPIPFINITLGYSPHINILNAEQYSIKDFPKLRISMAFEKFSKYDYKFQSKIAGRGSIYIEEVYIYDYLGFFRIKLKNISSSTDVFIIPEVKDIKSSQTLFNNICNSIITNDEEETSNDNTISIGSTLGYLHRDYIMGDSPRRINWKLSCKKDKLMVRLDEPSPQSKPYFLIDMSLNKEDTDQLSNIVAFEKLIESALSLLNMCMKYGVECECMLCNCDNLNKYTLTSIYDIYSLAILISHSSENGNHTLPSEISNLKTSDSMYIMFTDFYNQELQSKIQSIQDKGINFTTVLSPRYYEKFSSSTVWVVNDDLSITSSGI
ncbi:MAG: DUF58 domain-containing protein [Oscillospiraceae bacterium]